MTPVMTPVMDAVSAAIADERDASAWDTFVAGHPEATAYHEWAWRNIFRNAFGHDSFYLAAYRGERLAGVLPLVFIRHPLFGRSLTSMAFLNYGGVLTSDAEAGAALLDAAKRVAVQQGCRHVELRHVARRFSTLPCRQHKVTMLLDLGAGMWDGLDRKVRNQIRKAQKSNLVVESGGAGLLTDFYQVFARNMRDLGTPVYSPRLFSEVLRAFPSRATIHVVRLDGRPIAAGLTLETRGRIEVPWASSIRDFNALCPNHLLYWHIIESAAARGLATMDFGRSTPNEGTFKFKEQWGARAVPLHWEYLTTKGDSVPAIAAGNPKLHLMVEAWKRLPMSVATALGPHIVCGIP